MLPTESYTYWPVLNVYGPDSAVGWCCGASSARRGERDRRAVMAVRIRLLITSPPHGALRHPISRLEDRSEARPVCSSSQATQERRELLPRRLSSRSSASRK